MFPKKSLKLTRKREQVKRDVSQAGISEAPVSSLGCVPEAPVQSYSIMPEVLENVGRRLFPKFVAWLLSRLVLCYFDLMMLFAFVVAESLYRSCSALPFRERMHLCHSLRF